MSKLDPRYFVIDGRPVKVVTRDGDIDVLAMDPSTGAMIPDARYRDRVSGGAVDKDTYMALIDRLRQPILERYATAPLQWESNDDDDAPYRLTVDGHELTIRMGDFPDEALYLMHIDGQGVYAIDDWPSAWDKPGQRRQRPDLVAQSRQESGTSVLPRFESSPQSVFLHGPLEKDCRATTPERAILTRNVCSNDGWVVDSRELASDPVDHDAPILPKLGCTNLVCALCYQKVRSVGGVILRNLGAPVDERSLYDELGGSKRLEPSPAYRLYVCHCATHMEGGEHPLDDKEGVQVGTQWTCGGHPIAVLPRVFDGANVTADNLAEVVAAALANDLPANLRSSDRRDGVWAARLAVRLDGTPHQERVIAVAAVQLTHADATLRARAVQFFVNAPGFAAHMRADLLLGRYADLFVDVPNPLGSWSFEKTLEYLVWRLSGPQLPTNPALRELAHAYALDPRRSSEVLFIALVQNDASWFADNAARLASANPSRIDELLFAVDGAGLPPSVANAIKHATIA